MDGPPLGPGYWGSTRLPIADDLGARFRNVLTDEILEPATTAEGRGLALARVLANFPVALLESA